MLDFEKQWIRKIKKTNDEESANKLIHTYYKEIFALTYKKCFDEQLALDLTQEIFIQVLQSIHHFDEKKASFRTWLYKIATNYYADYFRSKTFQMTKHTVHQEVIEIASEDYAIKYIFQKEQLDEFQQIIHTFEEEERLILLYKLLHELTFVEIAAKLQLPVSTTKTKYYKSIKLLRAEWEAKSK